MCWQQIAKDSGGPSLTQRVRVKGRRDERLCPCSTLALAKPQVWPVESLKARESVATLSCPTELQEPIGAWSTQLSSSSAKCPKEARTLMHAENNPSVVKTVSSNITPSPLSLKMTTTAITTIAKNNDDDTSILETATTITDQPTTPALTLALTRTTDILDTDFQSAYSKTPSPQPLERASVATLRVA